mgnify:CR=1 FL=1
MLRNNKITVDDIRSKTEDEVSENINYDFNILKDLKANNSYGFSSFA